MTTLKQLKRKLLENPEVRAEYEALKLEERLAAELVRVRVAAGLTQAELGRRIGSKQAAIARMESGRYAPSLTTLKNYAEATGRRLVVAFESTAPTRRPQRVQRRSSAAD